MSTFKKTKMDRKISSVLGAINGARRYFCLLLAWNYPVDDVLQFEEVVYEWNLTSCNIVKQLHSDIVLEKVAWIPRRHWKMNWYMLLFFYLSRDPKIPWELFVFLNNQWEASPTFQSERGFWLAELVLWNAGNLGANIFVSKRCLKTKPTCLESWGFKLSNEVN